ncbi:MULTISPECIES: phosphopantetheine-binding protein [unclassified Streptomyces]|uniref:phosphopantetheine-binding protein n=1 Tax=unclassified Streptomyces TaxID=2593676 RepID=UPI0008551F74|nr:phosphopantetheine-binding protein [Streptomyces sp. DpondAA-F4]MYR70093.1 phosphopantetheine-binding protein [Streptomyces sp. SID4939]SCM14566.1 Aryl carrier domain-containing protein [Streptomyces sp. DpondAA-F4]
MNCHDLAHPFPARPRTRRRTSPLPADELRRDVAAAIGADPGTLTGDAHLVHLGVGSLEVMLLVTRWRRQGIPVDFAALTATPTLDAWHRHLTEAWAARDTDAA